MRWTYVALAVLPCLVGCSTEHVGSSSDDGDCTSHHELIADAPTRTALRDELLEQVDPRVRSLRVIDENAQDDKVVINLLDRHTRLVMSLDMWQREDGTWTAQRWAQCID
jgi:hypothetical protein